MKRLDQQNKRMEEKRRGIGFETVAGMGGGLSLKHSLDMTINISLQRGGELGRTPLEELS